MSTKDRNYIEDDCHVCGDVAIIIEQDKLYCPTCYLKREEMLRDERMGKDRRSRDKEMVSKYR